MLQYNGKNWSLGLIITCVYAKWLTVFVTFWEQYKITGEMLSNFGQPLFDCHRTTSMDAFGLISRTNTKRVISTFKFGCPHLTLKEGPKVKSNHTRRFQAHDFLYVGLPSQTSRTNNKQVISTFKFGCPHLTFKEGPKVKSDLTRRFPAHDFLYVGLPSQTSRTNNKRVISAFKFGCPHLTLKEGPKVKSDHTRRFPAHDFLYVGLPSQTSYV